MKCSCAKILFAICLSMLWLSPALAEGIATLNTDIAPGKWKGIRLKNLPKDAVVAVELETNGDIAVALMDKPNYLRYPAPPRPLFQGQLGKKLSFSVSIPETGHYFLVLDNRSGSLPRAVKVTVRATRSPADQMDAADKILHDFERQLHLIFMFEPFPIRVKQCGVPKAFVDTPGIVLCVEYPRQLYAALGERQEAVDALSFSIFHELGRVLLTQWDHPLFDNVEVADELAAVLMVMLNQKERAITMAEYLLKNPSASETIMKLLRDDRHPLSVQRAQNILRWLKDPQFVRRWQTVLVPHMQTALLKKLHLKPTPWTDLSLIDKELAVRRKANRTDIQSLDL